MGLQLKATGFSLFGYHRKRTEMFCYLKKLVGRIDGFYLDGDDLYFRQSSGWVRIHKPDIFAVKMKSVNRVILRFRDGRRMVLSLYKLANRNYDRACRNLTEGMEKIRHKRSGGTWTYEQRGAKKDQSTDMDLV
jgi:hypothetical protein